MHYRQVSTNYCWSRCLKIAIRSFRQLAQFRHRLHTYHTQRSNCSVRPGPAFCSQHGVFKLAHVPYSNTELQQSSPNEGGMHTAICYNLLENQPLQFNLSVHMRKGYGRSLCTAIVRGRKGRKLWHGDTFIALALNGTALYCQQLQALQKSSSFAIICFMLV